VLKILRALAGSLFQHKLEVVQFDLNVLKPESWRLEELYPGDSINMTNLRVYVSPPDEQKLLQLLKDKGIMQAIWNENVAVSFVGTNSRLIDDKDTSELSRKTYILLHD